MGVVTAASSAARTPLSLSAKISNYRSAAKNPLVVAFKEDKSSNTTLFAPRNQTPLPVQTSKGNKKRRKTNKEASLSTWDVDYNEAAAQLESIFKLSPPTDTSDVDVNGPIKKGCHRKSETDDGDEKPENRTRKTVVRNPVKKNRRMSLNRRISLRNNKEESEVTLRGENERIDELVRTYSASTDLVSMDWKKMKIPPVLASKEHTRLFKLMQPMKALLQVKDDLRKKLEREPTDSELAEATNTTMEQVRKQLEVGRAARNKLIKHNLRLVMFAMNKYFQDFVNSPRFQDLCQAGVKGLITAVDRFEPHRRFRLSTYSLFWIRHAIIRSMTLSSFTKVPFGLESIRSEIQKAKLELLIELRREPTEEEIIKKAGISAERYCEVTRTSKPVLSLHSRHSFTQEEFINGITDFDGGDNSRQPALLRLALDDVLDSLKPKESLVIRQRYGLDGKGDRTLGEIAGNLNISREMVRKYEMKALIKLKHPARVDYLRRYAV